MTGSHGRIAVFGAGSWGTAFSIVLADAGNDVTLWARREEVAAAVNEQRENAEYLPGIELPPAIQATHDVEKALHGADVVVLATPSHRCARTSRSGRRTSSPARSSSR